MKKCGQYLVALFYCLLCVACGGMISNYIQSTPAADLPFREYVLVLLLCLLGLYAVFFLQIIIHEAGHLIFGLLSGYRFSSFRIGNLIWVKENGKVRFRRLSLAGTGGQCLLCPPDMVDGKIPYVLYGLGGSLLNLFTVPLFLGMYFLCRNVLYLPLFFLLLAVIGFGFAFVNGVPMRTGTVDNDGYNAKSLGKSSTALRSYWIQMKMNEQMTKGVRLKEMPAEWFFLPADSEMQNSMTAAMAVFYENRLMDMHAFDEAERLIDKLQNMETAIVGFYGYLLVCDRLYCELIRGKDRETIQNLRTKKQVRFMKQMRKFPTVIRTEYAYAVLYERDTEESEALKAAFEKCAKTYPYKSDLESERELLYLADQAAKEADE